MSQGGRKPRPTESESDDTFDAKTVIRPSASRPSLDDEDDDGGEPTKPGSLLDQAFGERTMVMPSRAAKVPRPPEPPPREPRSAPEARVPQPPPRAKAQPKPEPEERLEISDETQWNSQISRLDITNPELEPIGRRSLKDSVTNVSKNAKIIGGAVVFLLVVFLLSRFTGRGESDAERAADSHPPAEVEKPKHAEKPKPAVTPPQQQAIGADGGVPAETVLQQFDQAFFSTQGQARAQ